MVDELWDVISREVEAIVPPLEGLSIDPDGGLQARLAASIGLTGHVLDLLEEEDGESWSQIDQVPAFAGRRRDAWSWLRESYRSGDPAAEAVERVIELVDDDGAIGARYGETRELVERPGSPGIRTILQGFEFP